MEEELGTFPFGQPVRKVEQMDRSSKKVFVLGVYASAVHAKWIGSDGKEKVRALTACPPAASRQTWAFLREVV
jgi:hypothetical protein